MGLSRKLVSEIKIKSDGDVFHQLLKEKPHEIASMTESIQNCELHQGQWGTPGSIISWNYTHDGKECVAKDRIEAIDEEKKSLTYKLIEGDLLEIYDSFKVTVHVDTNGDDNQKKNEHVPDPHSLMEVCLAGTKDIETYHLNQKP